MRTKNIIFSLAFLGGAAFVFFAIGSLTDDKFAAEFYIGANAFGDMYEAIGKMPAFVLLSVACGLCAQYFLRVWRNRIFAALFYVAMFAAAAINFKDLTDLLTDSALFSLAGCAVLGAMLATVIGFATARTDASRLPAYFKWSVAVAVAVVVIAVAVFAAKEIFSRARYIDVLNGSAQYAPWYDFVRVDGGDSMPSGHTAFTATLLMLLPLCAFHPRFVGKEKAVAVLAAAAMALTALARISDGHHYLSDVSAAAFIAVAVQTAVIFIMYGKHTDKPTFAKFFVPRSER